MTTTTAAAMEYVTAKTSVWWDIENCEVPRGYDSYAIAQNVSSALLKMKYCGSVSITAYGNTNLIPLHVQQALSSTGVGLNHVPAGIKDASDKKILVDMLLWAIDSPAPANFMLISGDRDFSYALHQLRMRRYNILLAQPLQASVPLVAAAKNVWLWTSLASGGPPLTSAESSRLLNNGRCQFSNYPVSEQAQSSKPVDSTSDAEDHKTREISLNKRRNKPQKQAQSSNPTDSTSGAKDTKDHKTRENHACCLCNVVCQSQVFFDSHMRGKKHASMLSQPEALIDSKKPQKDQPKETIVSQKEQLKEKIAEPKPNAEHVCCLCNVVCHSQIDFDSHLRGQKHGAMLSQSELDKSLIDSKKLQEKDFGEKDQTRETIAEPKPKAEHVCRMCNVPCHSQKVFHSHLRGKKHVAMLSQSGVLESNSVEEEEEEEEGRRRRTRRRRMRVKKHAVTVKKHVAMLSQSGELESNSAEEEEEVEEGRRRRRMRVKKHAVTVKKHVAMLSQSGALFDSKKLQEKCLEEKLENENKPLPNVEWIFTELNPEFSDARESFELSQDANVVQELESNSVEEEEGRRGRRSRRRRRRRSRE